MKTISLIIIMLFFVLSSSLLAGKDSDKISLIRKEYKTIKDNFKNYIKKEFTFSGESTEGAGGTGYVTKNGNIKLIEVTYYF